MSTPYLWGQNPARTTLDRNVPSYITSQAARLPLPVEPKRHLMSQNQNWPPSSGNIGNDFGLCQLLYSNGLHGQDPVSQLASYIHRHKTCEGRRRPTADRAAGLRHRLAAGGPSVYFNTGCLLTVQALSSTHLRRTKHILGTEGLL